MSDTGKTVALIKAIAGSGGGSGGVSDVKVAGTSVVSNGVASVPVADNDVFGTVKTSGVVNLDTNNRLRISGATVAQIISGNSSFPIMPNSQHAATFYGLAKASGDTTQKDSSNAVGTYTETARSKISDMLNAPVSVSGSTPSITAMSGVRYICGEVSTLSVTVPASGCVDIVFESGSTATVLTVTSAKTGVSAIKWANGWDGTCEANTVYEINVLDGEFGVMAAWT